MLVNTRSVTAGSAVVLTSITSTDEALLGLFLLGDIAAGFGEVAMNPLISKLYPERPGLIVYMLLYTIERNTFRVS